MGALWSGAGARPRTRRKEGLAELARFTVQEASKALLSFSTSKEGLSLLCTVLGQLEALSSN